MNSNMRCKKLEIKIWAKKARKDYISLWRCLTYATASLHLLVRYSRMAMLLVVAQLMLLPVLLPMLVLKLVPVAS